MTTIAAATATVDAAIDAGWASEPISWPNMPFTPPDNLPWLKVDYLWGDSFIATKDGLNTTVGVVQLTIFSPRDAGDGPWEPP